MSTVGIVYSGDRLAMQSGEIAGRFEGVARALESEGIRVVPTVYSDDFSEEFLAQASTLDGLLVWVNPIESGRDRFKLDLTLKHLAERGVMVSAHPDTILKMGTKQVLFDTKEMAWGSDVHVYRSLDELEDQLPQRVAEGQARVLKQYRGHSGGGIWKVRREADRYYARHAQRGCHEQERSFEDLLRLFATYFEADGRMIDQPYQERLPEGMIRCYQVVDRVEGFGHQEINALYPAPPGARPEDAPQPGPRLYHPPDRPEFQTIKRKMEDDWIPELLAGLGLERIQLPLLWDADFLLGPKDAHGEDTYVLCEINVSSVSPFPESAQAPLARATRDRLQTRR